MTAEYDQAILAHYDAVAARFGASPASTMEDEIIRSTETEIITSFIELVSLRVRAQQRRSTLRVADVGCGNGYTLSRLAAAMPHEFIGIEQNDRLRTIATERLKALPNVRIVPGDVRSAEIVSGPGADVDVLICQRVLINLLDAADQKCARDNIIALVRPGGCLIFVECFASALANLNDARVELGLSPIPPALHNLHLPEGFFDCPALSAFSDPDWTISARHLSTHYFVTRVLHEVALRSVGAPFVRNSHFVKFLSAALPPAVGDYSPLRVCALSKR
jgi:SAM-dependent methyltransferase